MKQFLREHWLYVAVPLAILIIAIAVVALTGSDPAGRFQY
jgi:hypothetical protein